MMAYIPERFQEKVAVVVGGAQGIGREIAVRLGLEGARLGYRGHRPKDDGANRKGDSSRQSGGSNRVLRRTSTSIGGANGCTGHTMVRTDRHPDVRRGCR